MRRFLLLLLSIGLLTWGHEVNAQQRVVTERFGAESVTILTDGLADPQGDISRAFGHLSQQVGSISKLRLLPLMGPGGPTNARDLIHMRGIDFAVMNSDVLTYIDLFGGPPAARRRLRYVTRLFNEKIYLIARKQVNSIEDLRGGKVMVIGKETSGFVSAMNLFRLLKIDIQVTSWISDATLNSASMGDADAALVVGRELLRVKFDAASNDELHILPVPLTPALARVYQPATIRRYEIPGMVPVEDVSTVQVATLLAVFDWTAIQSARQQTVAQFVKLFFESLPALRQVPQSIWRDTDIQAEVPDWERYGPADALRKTVKPAPAGTETVAQLPPWMTVPPPSGEMQRTAAAVPASVAPPEAGTLRAVVFSRPPLTDASQPGGGLLAELLAASLKSETSGGAPRTLKMAWAGSRGEALSSLLNEKPADVVLPWEAPDCDRPSDLGADSAVVCDRTLLSDQMFQVVVGLFVRADSDYTFENDTSVTGRTFCIPREMDTGDFNRDGRNWLTQRQITLVRGASLIECFGLVERGEADAAIANELEGRFILDRVGLAPSIRMLDRPLATHGLHAVVAKDHPQASEILRSINDGLAQLKKREDYLALVNKHVLGLLANR
jgi:hypothetical protein